jgi:hypothetical protein
LLGLDWTVATDDGQDNLDEMPKKSKKKGFFWKNKKKIGCAPYPSALLY